MAGGQELPAESAEVSKSFLDRVGAALPIALTALATAFAGLSTGELQKAMIYRSLAAQDQAKATSQWTLAGFKRDRALICQTAAAQLRAVPRPAGDTSPSPGSDGDEAAKWLAGQGPPPAKLPEVGDEHLAKLLDDIRVRAPDADIVRQARAVPAAVVNGAIDAAEKSVEETDRQWTPTVRAAQKLVTDSAKKPEGVAQQAAGFELDRRRYQAEAGLNQGVGYLYEARVKVSSATSEKHQQKSKNFFYAMLAAQIGATVSALALARRKQSLLWLIAGATGVVAIVIGAYVYLSDL